MPLPPKPQFSANRQPAGIPVGGAFAATAHTEPDVTLSSGEKFFNGEDTETDIMGNASTGDGYAGDNHIPDLPGDDGGDFPQPPLSGSSGEDEDEERKTSRVTVTNAFVRYATVLKNATSVRLTTNNYKKIRVEGIYDANGNSMDDYYGRLAESLNMEINTHAVGGRAVLAEHIIGSRKAATIDAQAAINGEIRILGLPPLS